ncbi:hypothetical protein ACILDU_02990 [Capnocytophaga canimorsus]|uniref:hypothetical protein n=1 Tax=Capnocytophaga canimorsus TaxID=28188 RepID=UPI0037D8162F
MYVVVFAVVLMLDVADRKETTSYTGLKNNLEYAKNQGSNSIVYDITDFKDWKTSEITRNLKGKIINYKGANFLKEVYFVNKGKVISFKKEDLFNNYVSVINKLETLK